MKKLLLVDADPFSLCVLDVSLRKAGYDVTTAGDGAEALAKIEAGAPDLVLSDTRLPKVDGFTFVRKLKDRPELARIPVVFLASQESIADRERALQLGVEDYLAKPAYLCELTARIDLLIARSTRQHVAASQVSGFGRGKLTGSTEDFALVDLLQNFERARKTGALYVRHGLQEVQIFFRDGKAVDARLGELRGEEAIYRALVWNEATFEIEFKSITEEDVIGRSMHAILMKGMRRVDDWVRLCKQVEPLATLLDVHPPLLVERLERMGEIPGDLQAMLHLPLRPPAEATAPTVVERTREEALEKVSRPAPEAPVVVTPRPAAGSVVVAPAPSSSATMTPPPPSSPPPPVRAVMSPPVLAVVAPTAPMAVVAASPSAASPSVPPRAQPSLRPSAAPWTREIDPEAPTDTDEVAAGVPRGIGAPARRTTFALAAAAAVLLVAGGVYTVRSHESRDADEATRASGDQVVAAAAPGAPSTEVAEPPSAAPAPSAEVAPAASEAASAAAPEGVTPPETAAVANTAAGALNTGAPAPNAAAVPTLPAGAVFGLLGVSPVHAPAQNTRETMLDVKTALTSTSPLVRDAERALLKGDTDKAQALSQQAVSENPGDADAWLTLAAARKASGDMASAREAYRSCIEQAHTVDVDHCRVLASTR